MHLGRHMATTHGRAFKNRAVKSISATTKSALSMGGTLGNRLAGQLEIILSKLQAGRQKLAEELHSMDSVLERFGISFAGQQRSSASSRPKRGRPKKSGRGPSRSRKAGVAKAAKKRRGRRKFEVSGPEMILGVVKAAGAKGATTAQINERWKAEGRSGDAYVALGQLVKAKKLKKAKIENGRGSRYMAA
jgi:hypothetical protein